jgi:hypothetical protein
MDNYNEACLAHASAQGLDPIVAELKAAGIKHHLWQSGGFCMIVVVPTGSTEAWMTNIEETRGAGPPGAYITAGHICHSGSEEDYDNCEACEAEGDYLDFAHIAERIRTLKREEGE